MEHRMSKLIHEVFVTEERCQAELRLKAEERDYLTLTYNAECTPLLTSNNEDTLWYLVKLDPWDSM